MTRGPEADGPVKTVVLGCLELPGDDAELVAAKLVYRPRDCLAVNMVLCGPDGVEVGWTFAWDLLSRGLIGPVGEGDIRIRPFPGATSTVEVVLSTSFGATMRLPAKEVGYFVSKVRALATLDEPRVRPALDAELAAIMEEAQ